MIKAFVKKNTPLARAYPDYPQSATVTSQEENTMSFLQLNDKYWIPIYIFEDIYEAQKNNGD